MSCFVVFVWWFLHLGSTEGYKYQIVVHFFDLVALFTVVVKAGYRSICSKTLARFCSLKTWQRCVIISCSTQRCKAIHLTFERVWMNSPAIGHCRLYSIINGCLQSSLFKAILVLNNWKMDSSISTLSYSNPVSSLYHPVQKTNPHGHKSTFKLQWNGKTRQSTRQECSALCWRVFFLFNVLN